MSSRHVQSSSVSGRKRKKSVSDIINEQFGISDARRNSADEFDDFYGDGPMIDDYYEGNESGDENMDDNVDSRITPASKRHRAEDTSSRKKQEKRLRRRGPIDPSLSTGEYAATPVEVEAAMDDLFGALEMDEDDMSLDEGEGLQVNEKGKHRKAETEEEYIQWLEAQQKKRQRRRGAAGLTEEGDILQQIEALRSAQVELLQREQEGGSAADPEAKERVKAQEAIQHYVMLYSQLLRMRIKLQPVVTRAIAFPQYYALSDFIDNGDSQIREGTTAVVQSLRELLGKFHSLVAHNSQHKNKLNASPSGNAPNFKELNDSHRQIMGAVDACIELWGNKFVQSNSAKLHTVAQPLLQQIRGILSSKARLRARAQKNRAHVSILGHPEHYRATQTAEHKAARALHIADGDIDEEIYDDGEFLREVVRRGGVVKLQQQLQEMQRSLHPDEEPAKRGFHRLTKGKAVNYEPRPKLVGFMLPVPYTVSGQYEVLFKSLFQ